jgi:hypothetical protein
MVFVTPWGGGVSGVAQALADCFSRRSSGAAILHVALGLRPAIEGLSAVRALRFRRERGISF